MSVISFPKRGGRTSPQHEPACVEVNATVPDCEAVRDMFNEARIRVLARLWRAHWVMGKDAEARRVWADYVAAKAKRSPAQVARIEMARGLR
jgi:hypothetical protein